MTTSALCIVYTLIYKALPFFGRTIEFNTLTRLYAG